MLYMEQEQTKDKNWQLVAYLGGVHWNTIELGFQRSHRFATQRPGWHTLYDGFGTGREGCTRGSRLPDDAARTVCRRTIP